jgi:hypothetical protein
MFVVDVIGGLGNQMFQYAFARSLAIRRGLPVKLNLATFTSYALRRYGLSQFNVVEDIATPTDLTMMLRDGVIYRETAHYTFEPRALSLPAPAYLNGHFQSYKYFQDIEPLIRQEFTLKAPPDPLNAQVARMIGERNAVCLHVRRTDYVTDRGTNAVHGTCPPEYYAACVDYIRQRESELTLFVFSDDIYWAQANLRFEVPTIYVGHNAADRDAEDLRLMSACKHFVIANSSFSWWAAWLAAQPGRIVCAPGRWITANPDTGDLLPPDWVRAQY